MIGNDLLLLLNRLSNIHYLEVVATGFLTKIVLDRHQVTWWGVVYWTAVDLIIVFDRARIVVTRIVTVVYYWTVVVNWTVVIYWTAVVHRTVSVTLNAILVIRFLPFLAGNRATRRTRIFSV